MAETDVAKAVVNWLDDQHWNVYQEVQFSPQGPVADIVATRQQLVWIIETKTAFGFAVLEQATRWPVHFRSVAVPWARNRDYRVARYYYQVGVIEVNNGEDHFEKVQEIVGAPILTANHKTARRYAARLTELHKTFCAAGSKGAQHLTPYKRTMMEVRKIVTANPGCTVRFLFEQLGEMHYASAASFKGNIVKALDDLEKEWCRVDFSSRPYRLFARCPAEAI